MINNVWQRKRHQELVKMHYMKVDKDYPFPIGNEKEDYKVGELRGSRQRVQYCITAIEND